MNWYKWAQKKTLEEILSGLESNPAVSKETISWLKTLPKEQMGPAMNVLMKNPQANMDDIMKVFKKEEPLTKEQEELIAFYPSIKLWMKGILINLRGQKRQAAYIALREEAARIRDWAERTGENLKGRTLENAIQETEQWHKEQAAVANGNYLPTKAEDIVIKYNNGYTWQRISRGVDVKIEGNKMNHCVGSYCEDVKNEKINVYSLRDKNNDPVITAGFKYDNALVIQMKGKDDTDPVGTYRSYINDILKKLGTRYNDGEYYLISKEFDLKDFYSVKESDIDKDPFLQRIITNEIIRTSTPPNFGKRWAQDKLESGRAPQEWIDAINKKMASDGTPPSFAWGWAKAKMNSGKAPKEWIDGIITATKWEDNSDGDGQHEVDDYKRNWAEEIVEYGSAPKELFEAIDKKIASDGNPPFLLTEWARRKLYANEAKVEWKEAIGRAIVADGESPPWATNWASEQLENGHAPQEWIEAISKRIVLKGIPPYFAHNWAKATLNSGKAPKEWINVIINDIESINSEEDFIYGFAGWTTEWVKKELDSGNAPKRLTDAITRLISLSGFMPRYAEDWGKKILTSGQAPSEWTDRISNTIIKTGQPPYYAVDWAESILDSGQAPSAWINAIFKKFMGYKRTREEGYGAFGAHWLKETLDSGQAPKELTDEIIKDYSSYVYEHANEKRRSSRRGTVGKQMPSDIGKVYSKWVEKQFKLGNVPQEWINAITEYIKSVKDYPYYMTDWLANHLNSNKASKELINALFFAALADESQNTIDTKITEWIRKLLDSGRAPKEWTDALSKTFISKEKVPRFAYQWFKNYLDSGNAPKEWIDVLMKMMPYQISNSRLLHYNAWHDWAKKILDSGNAPKEWIDALHKDIINDKHNHVFAQDWAKKILDSGNAPQEWIKTINRRIINHGFPEPFAHQWAKNILDSGNASQEWIDTIKKITSKNGSPPMWARDWAQKNGLI
jgi:hypothetical protein